MRKKIVAGNWKMNLLNREANDLFASISNTVIADVQLIVFPPFLFVGDLIKKEAKVAVGVQNFYPKDKGAYTGEISISQVKDAGVKYALVGHSERRLYFNESNSFLKEKVDAGLEQGVTIVFCCGEPLEIREAGKEFLHMNLFGQSEQVKLLQ